MACQYLPGRGVRRAVPSVLVLVRPEEGLDAQVRAAAGDPLVLRGRDRPLRPAPSDPLRTEATSARFDEDAGSGTSPSPTAHRSPPTCSSRGSVSSTVRSRRDRRPRRVRRRRSTRRWDHDIDLAGRRVGVIGNGASTVQFLPPTAEVAGHLTLFQRSANWILPKPDREFSPLERRIFRNVPFAERLFRWNIYWRLEKNFFFMRRGSRLGKLIERVASKELRKIVSDDLPAEALIPDYPPGCKRILISNEYYASLLRPNVEVELSPSTTSSPEPWSLPTAPSRARRAHLRDRVPQHRVPGADGGDRPTRRTSTRPGRRGPRRTSVSPSPASPTSSCSTARTPTSDTTRSSS